MSLAPAYIPDADKNFLETLIGLGDEDYQIISSRTGSLEQQASFQKHFVLFLSFSSNKSQF